MPCRAGPNPHQSSKTDNIRKEVNNLREDLNEKERELCKLRTLLFSDDISEEDLKKQREKHLEHREEDLEYAREQTQDKLSNVKERIQKIGSMGGEPKPKLKNALAEAQKAHKKAQNLEPEDLLKTDAPLEDIHSRLRTVKNALQTK